MMDLSTMIGRCSFESQDEGPDWRPENVGCSNFRYKNKDQSNYSMEKQKRKNEPEKTTKMYFTDIFKVILYKESREK